MATVNPNAYAGYGGGGIEPDILPGNYSNYAPGSFGGTATPQPAPQPTPQPYSPPSSWNLADGSTPQFNWPGSSYGGGQPQVDVGGGLGNLYSYYGVSPGGYIPGGSLPGYGGQPQVDVGGGGHPAGSPSQPGNAIAGFGGLGQSIGFGSTPFAGYQGTASQYATQWSYVPGLGYVPRAQAANQSGSPTGPYDSSPAFSAAAGGRPSPDAVKENANGTFGSGGAAWRIGAPPQGFLWQ